MVGGSVPGSVRTRPAGIPAQAGPARKRAAGLYDRHGLRLYRQAHLTLGDQGLAEQVVCDVLVGECLRPPAAGEELDTGRRLAVAAYRRCRELTAPHAWPQLPPAGPQGFADAQEPGQLSASERGTLALVLIGGLSYAQAGHELSIPPPEMAAALRAIMGRLAPARPN
jgi:DNA-directed RNA polymerase specialized sigma24 family protein